MNHSLFYKRRFLLFSVLCFPLRFHEKRIQTTYIISKNQSFPNVHLFRKTFHSMYSNHPNLFKPLDSFRKKGIIVKEERLLLSPNKMRLKRLWLSKNYYRKWKKMNEQKIAYNILKNNNRFLMSEKLSNF